MNIALARLFEGIVATLRADVIPHVSDSYARGQAVGVIDLINNIGPRVEWARAPALASVGEKRRLLRAVAETLGEPAPSEADSPDAMSSDELLSEKFRLDAAICEAMRRAHARSDDAARQALGRIINHAHEEATRDLKLTRKPLFAEIASGRDERASTN